MDGTEAGRRAWFAGDPGDPWVQAIAASLPAGARLLPCAGDLPDQWPDEPVGTLILHRQYLTNGDAARLRRLRDRPDPPGRVVVCVGPYARYHQTLRWQPLVDRFLPEATAAETLARLLSDAAGPRVAGPRPLVRVVSSEAALRRVLTEIVQGAGFPANPSSELPQPEAGSRTDDHFFVTDPAVQSPPCQGGGGGVAPPHGGLAPGSFPARTPPDPPLARGGGERSRQPSPPLAKGGPEAGWRGPIVWDVPVLEPDWPARMRRAAAAGPVVALIGLADRATVAQARACGAAACLDLPCDPADLVFVLDRLAEWPGGMSPPTIPRYGQEAPSAPVLDGTGPGPAPRPGRRGSRSRPIRPRRSSPEPGGGIRRSRP